MEYRLVEILTEAERKNIFSFLDKCGASLLQYPEWIDMIYPEREKKYFIASENNSLVSYALICVRLFHGVLWFGPVCENETMVANSVYHIAELCKKNGIGLITLINLYPNLIRNQIFENIHEKFSISKNNIIEPWATIKIDLSKNVEELFSNFSDNHKRSVKKAMQMQFIVREINTEDELMEFASLYIQMYKHRKIIMPIRDAGNLFIDINNLFARYNKGSIWGIFDKDEMLGGIIIGYHGETAFYHYGATNIKHSKKSILHMAFYRVIEFLKENNFKYFDLGGYALKEKDDQLLNINRFKNGFGGSIINYGNPISIILNHKKFWLFSISRKIYFNIRNCLKFIL